jgi:prophage regulatory protein
MHSLVEPRYVRVAQIVGKPATESAEEIKPIVPVCRSTWLAWVKTKKAPQPIRLSPGVTVWRYSDVAAFAESMAGGEP